MSLKVEFRKDRNTWQVVYYLDGKRKRPSFLTETEAVNFARRIQAGLGRDEKYNTTIADAAKKYFTSESVKKDPKSAANDKRYLNLLFHFMTVERGLECLGSIELEDLEAFRDWLVQQTEYDGRPMKMGPSTVNRCLRVLKHFFKRHVQWKTIGESPCGYLEFLESEEKPRKVMTQADFFVAYEMAPEWFRPIFRFILLTGAPPTCVSRLTWEDVNFSGRTYSIHRKKGRHRRLKSIPLPMTDAVFAELIALRNADPAAEGPVFKTESGRAIRPDRISRVGNRAIRDAGIKGVTVYGLRHALASDMTNAGIATELIRQVMGHASIQTTQRYANKTHLTAVSNALETVRGGSLVAK